MNKNIRKPKSCITGIGGFVASHMADLLLEKGEEVIGTYRWFEDLERIEHIKDKIIMAPMDLIDMGSCLRCIRDYKPDYIYHLAAQSFVPDSFIYPAMTIMTNTVGTANLLEAIRQVMVEDKSYNPVIFVCSSSEVYGQTNEDEVPVKESQPFRPQNPYAASKVGADMIAYVYFKCYNMKILRTRMYTHSVSKWSPVIIRDDESGIIDIKYISEIRQAKKPDGYLSGRMEGDTQIWDLSYHKVSVWADSGWQELKSISCHPINNRKLLRITTRGSVFEVTDNHSILDGRGLVKDASTAKKGDTILQYSLPCVSKMVGSSDLAWLYGFFAAEGSMANGLRGQTFRFSISNTKKELLERCQQIILRHWGKYSVIRLESDGLWRLTMRRVSRMTRFLYSEFYASDKNKRVPVSILNSTKSVKLAFLRGYNAGDGRMPLANSRWGHHQEFIGFKTKSPILALGLCLLVENTTKQRYTISVEQRGDKTYYEITLNSVKNHHYGIQNRKPQDKIVSVFNVPYKDEVWDFETENNHFHCGIGKGIVHNTGPRRTMSSMESSFARQIAMIEAGLQEPVVKVGNLESIRTIADVRDAAKAYYLLVRKCKYGEVYNIGGDRTMKVGDVLKYLISLSPMKDKIKVEVDPKLLRPSDVTLQIPSSEKFKKETGWEPEIPFEKTMLDLLEFWRDKVRRQKQ